MLITLSIQALNCNFLNSSSSHYPLVSCTVDFLIHPQTQPSSKSHNPIDVKVLNKKGTLFIKKVNKRTNIKATKSHYKGKKYNSFIMPYFITKLLTLTNFNNCSTGNSSTFSFCLEQKKVFNFLKNKINFKFIFLTD